MKQWLGMVSLLLLIACNDNSRSPLETPIYNQEGDRIGSATFREQAEGVEVKVTVEGLEPGVHGIHVHERPECKGPDFKSAGNHFNPKNADHGLMNENGAHIGDLPNIEAGGDGTVDVELMLPEATLKDGQTSLLRDEGTSLVIHSEADDGMSQPAGDSGERVACAEITVDADDDESSDPTELNENQE
ncbi:superoxide dismutase [Halobacillus andaensis]|uniref:Superoxide dismutase [Cu-Zn] n=1 Tax=Halobacillus andaensis TaxID=1176239 RepID=A0A917BAH7_HALAA|nr:superoxide dismutase family protein [Halobacillus andaensis]MBP2005601.1 Cu-Zn family superoxide dismutase [Halobacillus andaensis]GGF32767.1 superoxide dismutase [Halobacillus andaensis]